MPKNKHIRLIFNPATETEGGATLPIENKCLDGIDEVYGFHSEPSFDEGDIRIHGQRYPEQTEAVTQICKDYFGEAHLKVEDKPFVGFTPF